MTTVDLGKAGRQMSRQQLELPLEDRGEAPNVRRSVEARPAAHGDERSGSDHEGLMELVVERDNLERALKRVRQNRGGPGIDGMSTGELPEYLKEHWPRIREQLLEGTYEPMAVRRQEIPKGGGGVRQLGIPTVLDRVNHEGPTFGRCPMGRLAKRVGDKRLLRIIRRCVEAGVMADGVVVERYRGTGRTAVTASCEHAPR